MSKYNNSANVGGGSTNGRVMRNSAGGGSNQRGPHASSGRSRPPQTGAENKEVPQEGVYLNERLMYALTSLIGCNVEVYVRNGECFEGIFKTFSQHFEVVLLLATKKSEDGSSDGMGDIREDLKTIIIRPNEIVYIQALNVDLEYAVTAESSTVADGTSGGGRSNGQAWERELEPWDGGMDEGGTMLELDDGIRGGGWNAADMFRTNMEKFNVGTSFDSDLSQYTTKLTREDTAEYRERERKAEMLAAEIERTCVYRDRAALENGDNEQDEEMAFSAVHRSNNSKSTGGPVQSTPVDGRPLSSGGGSSSGKYVAPHLRAQQNRGVSPATVNQSADQQVEGVTADSPVAENQQLRRAEGSVKDTAASESLRQFSKNFILSQEVKRGSRRQGVSPDTTQQLAPSSPPVAGVEGVPQGTVRMPDGFVDVNQSSGGAPSQPVDVVSQSSVHVMGVASPAVGPTVGVISQTVAHVGVASPVAGPTVGVASPSVGLPVGVVSQAGAHGGVASQAGISKGVVSQTGAHVGVISQAGGPAVGVVSQAGALPVGVALQAVGPPVGVVSQPVGMFSQTGVPMGVISQATGLPVGGVAGIQQQHIQQQTGLATAADTNDRSPPQLKQLELAETGLAQHQQQQQSAGEDIGRKEDVGMMPMDGVGSMPGGEAGSDSSGAKKSSTLNPLAKEFNPLAIKSFIPQRTPSVQTPPSSSSSPAGMVLPSVGPPTMVYAVPPPPNIPSGAGGMLPAPSVNMAPPTQIMYTQYLPAAAAAQQRFQQQQQQQQRKQVTVSARAMPEMQGAHPAAAMAAGTPLISAQTSGLTGPGLTHATPGATPVFLQAPPMHQQMMVAPLYPQQYRLVGMPQTMMQVHDASGNHVLLHTQSVMAAPPPHHIQQSLGPPPTPQGGQQPHHPYMTLPPNMSSTVTSGTAGVQSSGAPHIMNNPTSPQQLVLHTGGGPPQFNPYPGQGGGQQGTPQGVMVHPSGAVHPHMISMLQTQGGNGSNGGGGHMISGTHMTHSGGGAMTHSAGLQHPGSAHPQHLQQLQQQHGGVVNIYSLHPPSMSSPPHGYNTGGQGGQHSQQ